MASAKIIRSNAISIPESPTTSRTALDIQKSVNNAIVHKLRAAFPSERVGNTLDWDDVGEIREVTLLAKGGYNSVWLVRLRECFEIAPTASTESDSSLVRRSSFDRYVLRLPCDDALLPYQVTNEVAFKKFVASKLPHIPVPQVFFYEATARPDDSFIAEEYIDGLPLSANWMALTPSQKERMANKLATITVDLAEVHFKMIGGLDPISFASAPTVEGSKLFKGRGKFHSYNHYPIGPYKSTKEYILACYEREICYYTHVPEYDLDRGLFQDISVEEFIVKLQKKRDDLATTDMADEPFTLVHGDFHGRNILVDGDQILAIIDWEFAGSYPLSETLMGGGIDVVDADSEKLDAENTMWNRTIRDLVRQEVETRGWHKDEIVLLMGDGDPELGRARQEMFP